MFICLTQLVCFSEHSLGCVAPSEPHSGSYISLQMLLQTQRALLFTAEHTPSNKQEDEAQTSKITQQEEHQG